MFGETMDKYTIDNIEEMDKIDGNQDNLDNPKKQQINKKNAKKLDERYTSFHSGKMNERQKFFRYAEPNKIKMGDSSETFWDKAKIVRDSVNGKGQNTLPGFEKQIGNKNVCVEAYRDSFHVSVTGDQGGWIDIVFDNIPQNSGQQEQNIQFINMKITGDVLNQKSLKQFDSAWAKEFPGGLIPSDNPKDVKKVLLGIEKLIINPEIQSVAGTNKKKEEAQHEAEEKKEKRYNELVLLLIELTTFNPQKTNDEIAEYLKNEINFENNQYKYQRQILYSLIVLHRHSSFSEIVDKMKNKNLEDLQENTQRNADEKNIDDGELIVEYLSNNPSLQKDIVDDGENLINQAIHSLENSAINDIFPSADEIAFLQS